MSAIRDYHVAALASLSYGELVAEDLRIAKSIDSAVAAGRPLEERAWRERLGMSQSELFRRNFPDASSTPDYLHTREDVIAELASTLEEYQVWLAMDGRWSLEDADFSVMATLESALELLRAVKL